LIALAASLVNAAPALAAWPGVESAQPLVQAPRVCSPNIVPINRRCRVVDFAFLGNLDGRDWYYAFYATHWADRHGRMDRGFPVFLYLEKPATLRLGLWVNDAPGLSGRWASRPPPRPILIRQPDQTLLGLTLQNVGSTPDQRLFRLNGERWSQILILRRSPEDIALIRSATPRGCSLSGDGHFDWTAFQVTWPLSSDLTGGSCGVLVGSLAARGDRLRLTEIKYQR